VRSPAARTSIGPEAHNGADGTVPVDLYVPGRPPHPYTILEGLVGLIGRLGKQRKRAAVDRSRDPAWASPPRPPAPAATDDDAKSGEGDAS
jgi:NADH:ubiquinone oxidoreductase subunit B-like Fe-S oxidoreductase